MWRYDGMLYGLHRLCDTADLALQQAVEQLNGAGHRLPAEEIEDTLVGRDVIAGRWSFQLVEDYDRNYWSVFRDVEAHARAAVGDSALHVYEAEMKHREQRPRADDETR